tara:strand:- start:997 stop:1401 length:405 start_codon:yes stop_codon:yes gene_type:complete
MASGIYNRFKANLMNKVVDLEADTIKVMLMSSSHSFAATNNVIGDVSTNQVSGTGYTSGGAALGSKAVTQAATTKFDAADTAWTTVTVTTSHAVIYDETATSNLIASLDFGGSQVMVGVDFTIAWNAAGIITLA